MNAQQLFDHILIKQVIGRLDIEVNDITTDSRQAKAGSIFVASKAIPSIVIVLRKTS